MLFNADRGRKKQSLSIFATTNKGLANIGLGNDELFAMEQKFGQGTATHVVVEPKERVFYCVDSSTESRQEFVTAYRLH